MNYDELEEAYYKEKKKNSTLEDTITDVLGTIRELKESFLGMEVQQDTLVEINKAQEEELISLKAECERISNLSTDQLSQIATMQYDVGNQVVKVTDLEQRLINTECDVVANKTDTTSMQFSIDSLQSTVGGITGLAGGDMVASQQFVADAVNRECSNVFDELVKEIPYAVDDFLFLQRKKKQKAMIGDDDWLSDADEYPRPNYA